MPRRIDPPRMDDADLDDLVAHYLALAGPSQRTQSNHRKHWPRWVTFCTDRIDPLEPTTADLIEYVNAFADGTGPGTYRAYLSSIAWHCADAGTPDLTQHPLVKKAVDERVADEARRPTRGTGREAKALSAGLLEAVLTFPPPAPSPRVVLLRARWVLSWAFERNALDRFTGIRSSDVTSSADRLQIGDQVVSATGGWACPVEAWNALVSSGFVGGSEGLFVGVHCDDDGRWETALPCDVDKLHRSWLRNVLRRTFGVPGPAAWSGVESRALIADSEDLARTVVNGDGELWRWYWDSAVLALQMWGGLGAADSARLRWRLLELDDGDDVEVRTPWVRTQDRSDHIRVIPALPDDPDLCGATAVREWRWLTRHRLGPDDPVIPRLEAGGRDYRCEPLNLDRRAGDVISQLSAPLKSRLRDLEVDPAGYASTSGRKTMELLVLRGGGHPSDTDHHLGRRTAKTSKARRTGRTALANPKSGANTMDWS